MREGLRKLATALSLLATAEIAAAQNPSDIKILKDESRGKISQALEKEDKSLQNAPPGFSTTIVNPNDPWNCTPTGHAFVGGDSGTRFEVDLAYQISDTNKRCLEPIPLTDNAVS